MTANQIAFQRMQEEKRANRRQEELKAYEQGIEKNKAKSQSRQADAAWLNAIVSQHEHIRKQDESLSQRAANWGSVVGNALKGISAFASLFA